MTNKSTQFSFSLISLLALSACGTSLPQKDKNPSLAHNDGYFVSREEAAARGGVGNYVPKYCSGGGWGMPASCAPDTQARNDSDIVEISAASPMPTSAALRVYFDTNRDSLSSAEKRKLEIWANSYGKQADRQSLELKGFADSRGTDEHNQDLSARRAEAIARELRNNGLKAKVAEVEGMGEIQGTSMEPRAHEARRVEINLE